MAKINYNNREFEITYEVEVYKSGDRKHTLTYRGRQFQEGTLEKAIKKFTEFIDRREKRK